MTTGNAESLGSGAYATSQSFVINLCSSTSPMALAHPSSPELKRYTFFVSRERQDGRDRFRLHMGYFASQGEAEVLLAAVRDVYPAAWAGPAPNQGAARRARITPAPPVPVRVAEPVAPVAALMPGPATFQPAASRANIATTLEQTMSEMRDVLSRLDDRTPPEPARHAPVRPEPPAVQPTKSDVRSVPPAAQSPALVVDPPRLHPVTQPRVAAAGPVATARELSPEQALNLLEIPSPAQSPDGQSNVGLLRPEDTQTLREINIDKANNAPPSFAVQLLWSVTPIDAASMPHMAIFDAYTLYNVEGNRQGRKWYGLRLGFFTDPNAATQVANYVRGDYRSVAVVPVSTKEVDHAGRGSAISPADSAITPPLKASEQLTTNSEAMAGFELVADDRPAPVKRELDRPRQMPGAKIVARAPLKSSSSSPPKAGKPTGKRAVSRKKPDRVVKVAPGAANVLESTLELLGASTLTIDDNKGLVIDEAASRRASRGHKKPQNGKFSKLLSRLGGG
jgi:hypothetical protein